MPSWKKVILSGSDAALNSLSVTTNVTASSFTGSFTGSFLGTASYASQALTASFASTASYVNILNQNVIISGSAAVGLTSLGANENTLTLGPSPAGGPGEGGQLGLNAAGGTYTSASFIDTWQNQFRILRGTNASSTGLAAQWDLHTLQMQLPAYTSATSFVGTASANLAVDSSGNIITVSTVAAPFPYTGDAVITGSLTTTGIIYAKPNGGMYFQGGDDAALYDVNVVNTLGVYGVQDSTVGSVKLGSGGGVISGKDNRIGIGTTNPVSGSLEVNGNVYATSFTGSLLGTASYASQALSSSYALSGSYSLTATSASHALNANNAITASYALQALSSSYALTASYAPNLVISGSINNVNYIDFNTGSGDPGWKSGRVYFNNTDGALTVYNAEADISLQVGQENWTRVRNNTGTTITNGTPVRLSGAQGDVPTVVRAQSIAKSGSVNTDNQILGLATHDIGAGEFGYITTQGLVRGINTNAFNDGDTLFVGTGSAGVLQNVPPRAPFEIIPIGVCVKASPGGSGIIYVAVQQPYDFSDLSSVLVTGSYDYGDLWVYRPSGSLGVWSHQKQLSGSYGVTGSWSATSFTGSLLGTASYAAQALSSSYALSSSHAIFADTASFLPSTTNLNITSISASNATFLSASIGYLQTITGSAKIIGDAFIILNNDLPAERYAGLIVQDSGSTLTTASFQYDGQTNDWFYEYSDDGGVTSDHAVAIFGPEYNTKGSPTYLTANRIPKSDGTHHLNDSNISDNGTVVSINSNTQVTGSLNVSSNITSQTLNVTSGTGSFTGSFTGLFDGISASQIATGTGTINTLAKWNTTSSLTDSNITDNGSNVRVAVTTAITGSIINNNAGFTSTTFASGSSIANATTNGTLFTIDGTVYESITMEYVIFDSTKANKRAGTLRGTWNSNTSAVVFDETTTTDIGNTSAFTLNVANLGSGIMSVRATNNVGSAMTIIYERKLLG